MTPKEHEDYCLEQFGEFPGCYRLPDKDTPVLTDKSALAIINNYNKQLRSQIDEMKNLLLQHRDDLMSEAIQYAYDGNNEAEQCALNRIKEINRVLKSA